MSETTLAYSVGQNKKHGGFYPRLINVNEEFIDLMAHEPITGRIILLSKNEKPTAEDFSDQFEVFDVGRPGEEFLTALRDQSDEKLPVTSRVAVEEFGHSVIYDEKVPVRWVPSVTLEVSAVTGFSFIESKPLDGVEMYTYLVTLANGWEFKLVVLSTRDPSLMREDIGFNSSSISINGVIHTLFQEPRSHASAGKAAYETLTAMVDIYCVKARFLDLDDLEIKQIKAAFSAA